MLVLKLISIINDFEIIISVTNVQPNSVTTRMKNSEGK